MTAALVTALLPLIAALVVVVITVRRNKRLDKSDGGSIFVALSAGFAVPKGLFLCWYYISPDPPGVATKLRGYEKEIFIAGALVVFFAIASFWSVCHKDSIAPDPPGNDKGAETV